VGWDDWIRTIEVEPSLYAADFGRLGDQVEVLCRAGVRVFHFDVGDGHFVPPITMGPVVLRGIAPIGRRHEARFDCHLMVDNPGRHFAELKESGADSVTVHYEVCGRDLPGIAALARELELGFGVAFNPESGPEDVAQAAAAASADLVLCLSIHPGYSGQEFMPEALDRVRRLRELLPPGMHVQVDGGVGHDNVRALYDAGADLLVAGTAIFGREDLPRSFRRLVEALR
jgi:ribulose-phosphate 3-epimerase